MTNQMTLERIREEIKLIQKYNGKNIYAWTQNQIRVGFNLPEIEEQNYIF